MPPFKLCLFFRDRRPETCNCDVIVLSFRTKCQVQKSPHITYLFDPNTGWGTGRNELYFAAITRSPKYHYYIFMDDDVMLNFNSFAPPQMKKLPPFRVFEQWLLDYEPVVGVLDYGVHYGASWTKDRRRMGNRTKWAVFCCNNEIPKIPLLHFYGWWCDAEFQFICSATNEEASAV